MKKLLTVCFLLFLLAPSVFAGLKTNQPAPDFSLTDSTGKQFKLSDMIGKEREKSGGIILNFFASWCGPCRDELPILNSAKDKLKTKNITIVLIGVKDDFTPITNMLRALNMNMPVVLNDASGDVVRKYDIHTVPTTYFIGSDGKVKSVFYGNFSNDRELMAEAKKLMVK